MLPPYVLVYTCVCCSVVGFASSHALRQALHTEQHSDSTCKVCVTRFRCDYTNSQHAAAVDQENVLGSWFPRLVRPYKPRLATSAHVTGPAALILNSPRPPARCSTDILSSCQISLEGPPSPASAPSPAAGGSDESLPLGSQSTFLTASVHHGVPCPVWYDGNFHDDDIQPKWCEWEPHPKRPAYAFCAGTASAPACSVAGRKTSCGRVEQSQQC